MPLTSRSNRLVPVGCLLWALVPGLAVAADAAGVGATAAPSPVDHAMMDGMGRMRQQMAAAPMTGQADHDFVAMMLPHHAGAVDMAEVELRYGRDPQMRRLARDIVAAQEREMKEMQAWTASHPAG